MGSVLAGVVVVFEELLRALAGADDAELALPVVAAEDADDLRAVVVDGAAGEAVVGGDARRPVLLAAEGGGAGELRAPDALLAVRARDEQEPLVLAQARLEGGRARPLRRAADAEQREVGLLVHAHD